MLSRPANSPLQRKMFFAPLLTVNRPDSLGILAVVSPGLCLNEAADLLDAFPGFDWGNGTGEWRSPADGATALPHTITDLCHRMRCRKGSWAARRSQSL